MDVTDSAAVHRVFADVRPWAVINAAGYVRVDDAERDEERCRRENVEGVVHLAAAAAAHDARFLTFSSDLVFDGRCERPYVEGDLLSPLNAYGRSKADAERALVQLGVDALIVRTAAFFGPWDPHNTVTRALSALLRGERVMLPGDAVVSPTYVPDLVDASLDLLIDWEQGVWHLVNAGVVSWFDLVCRAADRVGIPTALLDSCDTADLRLEAPRPLFSALGSERGAVMPPLDSALDRYARDVQALPRHALSAAG
jgi:dTDP-4-dehydrorhamnose reductase